MELLGYIGYAIYYLKIVHCLLLNQPDWYFDEIYSITNITAVYTIYFIEVSIWLVEQQT